MSLIDDLMSLANGCSMADSATGRRNGVDLVQDIDKEDTDIKWDSSVELATTTFSCVPVIRQRRTRRRGTPSSPKSRERVNWGGCDVDDIQAFVVPVATDVLVPPGTIGQASQELAVAKEVAVTELETQKKKRGNRISFSSEAETMTFEVFKDMTPIGDMSDEVLLKLQEEEKQREAEKTAAAAAELMETSGENSDGCRKVKDENDSVSLDLTSVGESARVDLASVDPACASFAKRTNRVSFKEEPEVVSYTRTEEDCELVAKVDVPRLSSALEGVNWNFMAMINDVSKIIVSPSVRPYLFDTRSQTAEAAMAASRRMEMLRERNCTCFTHELKDPSLEQLRQESQISSTSASTPADIVTKITSVSKVFALYGDGIVRSQVR